jgi:nucleotide-binding universal stress UspA family protein
MANAAGEIRVFLPLEPEEDVRIPGRIIQALFPAARTRLRRYYVCRPVQMDLYLPELSYSLPEVARLELEAQMAAAEHSRRAAQPLVDLGYRVESDVACGSPITEILREIDVWRADVTLVRTRRRNAEDQRLGQLAAALLHHATCPVLTYRDVEPGYEIRRVLIATDFSPASRVSADWGLALAEAAGAEAHLLHVLAEHGGRKILGEKRLVATATEEIQRWRSRASPAFPRPVTDAHVISAATPAEGILKFSADLGFDVVVLAGTGRSAVWAVLLGSNARTVARLSDRPVLLVPSSNRVGVESFVAKLAGGRVARDATASP